MHNPFTCTCASGLLYIINIIPARYTCESARKHPERDVVTHNWPRYEPRKITSVNLKIENIQFLEINVTTSIF